MSSDEIFQKEIARLGELEAEKNCIVCNFRNSRECPAKKGYAVKGKSCGKWQYYLGREIS